MLIDPARLAAALVLSTAIGWLGYRRGSLTRGGWLGAVLVGTSTAGLGGWMWGGLVVLFFVTSSALSHWRRGAKAGVARDKFAKGERRDLLQTLANGGATSILAVSYAIAPHPAVLAAGLGALATATADTWATELGTLSRTLPRLITSGRRVSPGTSGGITALGMAATLAGSFVIGAGAAVLSLVLGGGAAWWSGAPIAAGGVAGSLADSLLGATAQAMRWCSRCESQTERVVHGCGTPTTHLRGWRWLDNDGVNFAASVAGAAVAAAVALLVYST
jgi:uncharacterized protein (TIGR00297 family)